MGPTGRTVIRALTWSLVPALMAATIVLDARSATDAVRVSDVPLVAAVVACWAVGLVVTGRSWDQPAGWAFLGLGIALAWSAFTDTYAPVGEADPLPGYRLVAALGDSSFVWWFVFLALVLQLTPPGSPEDRLAARLSAVTVATGAVFQVLALLRSTPLDPPREDLVSPWAVAALDTPARAGGRVAIYLLGVLLVLSVVQLVRAWRRSRGDSRRQLLWLVAGATPVAPAVVAAFILSARGQNDVAGVLLGVAIVSLVAGAAFSVLRYRLYDVEHVVTESAAYAIACLSVIAVAATAVVVISSSTPIEAGSQLTAIAATLAAVAIARTSFVWGRRAVGRRVSRARFDAVEAVRRGLADHSVSLDALLAAALACEARVVYPAAGGTWVTEEGRPVAPADAYVTVRRRGALTARVEYDARVAAPEVVEAVVDAAAAEIENTALRAELARQVEVVIESRARLATAHLDERRQIERDLHDGAQQRLLAIALQLQAARVNGEPRVLSREVDRAITGIGETVQELRDLAGGIQPAVLAGGGLLAAVVDLAGRIPLRLQFDVVDHRFPPRVEAAAWFVIAEAMANVVKHAQTDAACITVTAADAALRVVVADRGVGGAKESGHGLQGLADRVGALGGTLRVREVDPHGTEVEAVLPCES